MITGGSVKISRVRKPGDYESRGAEVMIAFNVDQGEAEGDVLQYAAQLSHNQVYTALGWVEQPVGEQLPAAITKTGRGKKASASPAVADALIPTVASPVPDALAPVSLPVATPVSAPAASPSDPLAPAAVSQPVDTTSASVDFNGPAPVVALARMYDGQAGAEKLGQLCGEKAKSLGDPSKIWNLVRQYAPTDPRCGNIPEDKREEFAAALAKLA
jgi:hypothetical protein